MAIERKKSGVYKARYTKNGKKITVGTFPTRQAAEIALAKARGYNVKYKISEGRGTIISYAGTPEKPNSYINVSDRLPKSKRFIKWLKNLRAN